MLTQNLNDPNYINFLKEKEKFINKWKQKIPFKSDSEENKFIIAICNLLNKEQYKDNINIQENKEKIIEEIHLKVLN